MGSAEQAIRDVHSAWIDAVNAGELARLQSLMAEDVVFLSPGQAPVGRHQFPEGFTSAHRHSLVRCISELQEVHVAGDMAHTLCRDTLTVTPRAGGPTAKLAGHRLTIYRREADGRWRLARDAHTLSPVS